MSEDMPNERPASQDSKAAKIQFLCDLADWVGHCFECSHLSEVARILEKNIVVSHGPSVASPVVRVQLNVVSDIEKEWIEYHSRSKHVQAKHVQAKHDEFERFDFQVASPNSNSNHILAKVSLFFAASPRSHANPLSTASETAPFIQTLALTISRLRLQRNSHVQNQRFQNLTDHLNSGLLIEDEFENVVHVNTKFCSVFGLTSSPEELIRKYSGRRLRKEGMSQFCDLFLEPETVREELVSLVQNHIKRDGMRFELKDHRVVQMDYVPVLETSQIKGHMWKFRDVTHKVKREKSELEEQRLVRQMVRAAPVPMAMFDRDFKVLSKSRLWSQSLEIEALLREQKSSLLTTAESGKLFNTPLKVKTNNGEWAHFKAVIGPWYDLSGQIGGMIVVSSSVSELVIEREKAVLQSKMKSAFLANMSHEIRTPMNGVLGMLEVLSTTKLSPEQAGYVETIASSAESLLTILNDILDFSKIEAGKFELSEIWFNLFENLNSTLKTFESMANKKNIRLKLSFQANRDLEILADPMRLRQVVNNFLSNALKFTAEGEIELGLTLTDGNRLGLFVKDSGIGIPEDKLKEIFKPFEQADSSTSRKFGGTGLGLAITKSIIEMMKGKIIVETKVGVGSRFTVELDQLNVRTSVLSSEAGLTKIATPAPLTAWGESGRRVRVLIAEDNIVNQQVIELMMENLGIELKIVSNGLEAVEEVQRQSFDVIFLDCQMPLMDGYEAAQQICQLQRSQRVHRAPIAALTAHAFASEKEKCLSVGMQEFLTKPLTLKTLKAFLDRILPKESTMKLIDQEQIEQLKMIAGDDKDIAAAFFNKLIASFETSVPGKVIELRSHFVSQNILDLKKTAHYLKSTFGNLGMSQLQTCVLEIEKSCQANQLNGVEERIQIVEKELAPHLAELKGLVSEPLASESLLKSS